MIAQILLADDNADILTLMSEHLARRGHRVIAVADGVALAQKAAEHRPHLIVTDIKMPGSYGSSVYQVLQGDPHTNRIPIIFMSAHAAEKIAALLPKDPKTRFLKKPVDLKTLDATIAELLPLGGYVP
ncbi:MAG: response regulator [Elusimicrobia bacterium]|nr:response regulator [Elusimicrobiota bacterium]